MSAQLELTYPNAPGAKVPGTSQQAAESMKPTAATLRIQCMLFIDIKPMTADECAELMGASVLTIRPRISELNKLGKIIDTGIRRPNKSGRNAVVWKAA